MPAIALLMGQFQSCVGPNTSLEQLVQAQELRRYNLVYISSVFDCPEYCLARKPETKDTQRSVRV